MLGSRLAHDAIIERIYVRCLARKPTEEEKANLMKMVAESPNPTVGLEDVFGQ